jgi:hypothetical protein
MTRFERNETALIKKVVREQLSKPEVGVIDRVFEHTSPDDDSNFEVDVIFSGGEREEKRVPVHTPGSGQITPPKSGDKILVFFTEDSTNRPIAFGTGWSNEDRPPLGKAGMYRDRFDSDTSPSGDGDLNITGYTKYDGDPSTEDKRTLNAQQSFVQISKHAEGENVDPSKSGDLPAKIEMFDSPETDESWITVEINTRDGTNSDATWGIKFNIKTGEFKLIDPSGFGIISDGDGNFTWEYKSLTENQNDTGPLSL